MEFKDPGLLLLLTIIPLLVWRYIRRVRRGEESLRFSTTMALEGVRPSWTVSARHVLFGTGMLALALSIVALARPRQGTEVEEILSEGIDIIIALDASGSMEARDFEPRNRFFVAKAVAGKFIAGLRHDRAGLIVFAAKALTRCPPTLDYAVLQTVLENTQTGEIEDGTAIGSALATSLNRLRESTARSKVIILVTDGVNNRGEIQPLDAAEMARALGVKIYTVGVGSSGITQVPIQDPVYGKIFIEQRVEIDEASLTRIAEMTGGIYYRATDRPELEQIFEEIGRLEKSDIKVKTYRQYSERFLDFLMPALMLVLVAAVAGFTRFNKLP